MVGAGPAGTRAAERLAAAGLRPVVIDEAALNGGQIYRRQPAGFRRPAQTLYGFESGKAVAVHGAFAALGDRIDALKALTPFYVWKMKNMKPVDDADPFPNFDSFTSKIHATEHDDGTDEPGLRGRRRNGN